MDTIEPVAAPNAVTETARPGKRTKRAGRYAALPVRDHGGWRIRWIDASGKRRSRSFPADGYQAAVAELERVKGEVRAIKDGRAPRPVAAPTFADFWERFYRPNKTDQKRNPKDDNSIYKKHLKVEFGDLPVNRITTGHVEPFRTKLHRAKLKANTIRNILALLDAVLRYAQSMNYLYAPPKIEKPKTSLTTFNYLKTDAEIAAFLREAHKASDKAETAARERPTTDDRPIVGIEAYSLFAAALYSGMRAGELFGLRWSDVDFDRALITVQHSFDKPTKTGKVRHVPIMQTLAPILKAWRLKNNNGADGLVFPNGAGNMHTPSPRVITETFPAVVAAAGLAKLRFHDLRHTFASLWVMCGGDLFMLQKILGHSTQAMVQRYAHLAPEAFDKVRGIFGDAPPTTEPGEVVAFDDREKNSLRGQGEQESPASPGKLRNGSLTH
jgi:integrase